MASRCAFLPGQPDVPSSASDGWWLPVLLAVEAIFILAMIIFGGVVTGAALTAATGASTFAAAAVYLKPAVLQVGARMGLGGQERQVRAGPALPPLVVLVSLELSVVAAGVLGAGLDTSDALRLAAEITVLCIAICQGQPALLAVGRRMFPQDNGGR